MLIFLTAYVPSRVCDVACTSLSRHGFSLRHFPLSILIYVNPVVKCHYEQRHGSETILVDHLKPLGKERRKISR